MTISSPAKATAEKTTHAFLQKIHVAFVPGFMDRVLSETADGLMKQFRDLGHVVQEIPTDDTDIIITTSKYGEALNWRKSMQLTARLKYKLTRNPATFTLVHIEPDELEALLLYFEDVLEKVPPDPSDYQFPGLADDAYQVLFEQGRRGGPILSVERLVQAQAKSVRIMLVVGADEPECVYHFDLVGAYPKSPAANRLAFYNDIVLRLVTTVSTYEVTDHEVVEDPIPYATWQALETPDAMRFAAQELGKRTFFTEMVRIAALVNVPAVGDTIANQYSEGCFATWDPQLNALIATITGSARPVDKDNITEDDLAILVGVRPRGIGAQVRVVDGKRNDPPSSEAVEMMDMDSVLPLMHLGESWGTVADVPIVRSKLHGHRGVYSYDPRFVEYVPLDPPYFHYIVSCATEAQAKGVKGAFAKSLSLRDPDDPRQVVFTVLPGHGMMMVEKWVEGKRPFEVMWDYMDAGYIEIDSHVPQGPMVFETDNSGKAILVEESFDL